ncbi:unnamed protein product, partial [Owenia fusiformis]
HYKAVGIYRALTLNMMKMDLMLFLTLLLLVPLSTGLKVLLMPVPGVYSHLVYFTAVGEELLQQGHKVGIMVTPDLQGKLPTSFKNANVQIHLINTNKSEDEISGLVLKMANDQFKRASLFDVIPSMRRIVDVINDAVIAFLDDKKAMNSLRAGHYDIAIVDGFFMSGSPFIIPYALDIPFCSLSSMYHGTLMGIPALPSFVPSKGALYTDKMTFLQRVSSFFGTIIFDRIMSKVILGEAGGDSLVRKYAPNKPVMNIYPELKQQSLIWLIQQDSLLEFQCPVMDNVIMVGGLSVYPPQALSTELEEFISKATHGVIIVSFGSLLTTLDATITDKLITAFKGLKQSVIWKFTGNKEDLPPHIKLLKWLPQNDLLARPEVKLFITHCGNNGQFEALHYGVPMLGLPTTADQPHNAVRMQHKGYGIAMNMLDFTAEDLSRNINEILTNSTYKENIQKASMILRSKGSPRKRAVEAITHVAKFGGDHLRPSSLGMPFWKLWMLDIYVFLTIVVIILILLLKFLLKCAFKMAGRMYQSKIKVD